MDDDASLIRHDNSNDFLFHCLVMFFLREIVNRFSYIDILLYISYLVFILQEYTFHLLAIAAVATRPGLGIGVNLPIYPGAK